MYHGYIMVPNEAILKYDRDPSVTFKGDLKAYSTSITQDAFEKTIGVMNRSSRKTF
jgi:hypothetical protein